VPLRAPRVVFRILPIVLGLLVATLFAQGAKADDVYLDFACSGVQNCNGTVSNSGGNYSTTGITVTEGSGFYPSSETFTLAFDSATNAITINGPGGEDFVGQMTGFTATPASTTVDLNFMAIWPTLPADVQAYFNSATGVDSGFTIFLMSSNNITSADVTITAPEPGVPILLSSGMLALGFLLKRKAAVLAAASV